MKLRVKRLDIDAGSKYIVVLNDSDARELRVVPGGRVDVYKGSKSVTAIVDVSEKYVASGEVGLFADCWEALSVSDGEFVDIQPTVVPNSVFYIRKKIMGKKLTREEVYAIIGDIMKNKLTVAEAAAFVVAVHINGMDLDETVHLTEAIVRSGSTVKISKHPVVDKHCIGGVPNNRTTMIFVPVMAALGYYVPKTSSRAITSPAGTADTMEVLARVDLSVEEIKEITEAVGGVLAWGGGTDIAAADDRLIQIRRPLSLDPHALLLASIMAKKKAVNAEHVIIDIPIGPEAKVRDIKAGEALAEDFIHIGRRLGMDVVVVLSDGSQPIGNGVGPALEARDVLSILSGGGPKDLKRKAVELISQMLGYLRGVAPASVVPLVEETIRSGKALAKFREIIEAQDGDPDVSPEDIPVGKYCETVRAASDGKVLHVSNKVVAEVARLAGCPYDKGAGLYLHVHVGNKVKRGSPLFTVFSNSKKRLKCALEHASNVLSIGSND